MPVCTKPFKGVPDGETQTKNFTEGMAVEGELGKVAIANKWAELTKEEKDAEKKAADEKAAAEKKAADEKAAAEKKAADEKAKAGG